MVRCWGRSETTTADQECTDASSNVSLKLLQRMLWGCLFAALLTVIVVLSVFAHVGFSKADQEVVRITAPDRSGAIFNQSAVLDKHNGLVTYSVTSNANQTSTVLYDTKNGLVCYKPDNQDTCFLRKMEGSDFENVNSLLNVSDQQVSQFWLVGNETRRHSEFLGVIAGSPVDASDLQQPIQDLCQHSTLHWTKRADGPGKQRLIYFCIDICFPTNICVSVCFYYLPE